MKKGLLLAIFIFIFYHSFCQSNSYWQQQVNYQIDVSLNDTAKSLDGYLRLDYINHSPDTLRYIWFHVWPNAYKNDKTAFSDQLLENDRTDFYFSNEEKRGYINRLNFTVDKVTAVIQDHPQHQDIIKIILPKPLPPSQTVHIETPFHVKLPYNFSRGSYTSKTSFQITQWFPKPAVYDKYGWHEIPYLDQGEFYSEFGSFKVHITVPKGYVVAATGSLTSNDSNDPQTNSFMYEQDNIHDFAWFADKDFEVKEDTIQLATHTVKLHAYYNKKTAGSWTNVIEYMKNAVRTKSEWVGTYPYNDVSVVEKYTKMGGGGMEYPTITLIDGPVDNYTLNEVINHEIGHNWFYGILGSNERRFPWMDEGINTYYDIRYMSSVPKKSSKTNFIGKRTPAEDDMLPFLLSILVKSKKDQAISTDAADFSEMNYGAVAYYKTARWMKLLEASIGQPAFDKAMQDYYNKWKFKHPYPEDFKQTIRESTGQQHDSLFALLDKKGNIEPPAKKKLKLKSFFSFRNTDKYNYIFLSPAIGYNNYDKFMAGIVLHNYTLPLPNLKFILVPLYATGSKQLNGIGSISYGLPLDGRISKVAIGISGARFSTRQSLDTNDQKIFENFSKIVPSLQLYFRHHPRSEKNSWIDLRSYLITEKNFSAYGYKANSDSSVSYPLATANTNRYILQLSYNVNNHRKLYPYNYQLKYQQGKGFYRFDLNAEYFFNYSKYGGLNVRLFASKFGFIGSPDYEAYLYRPKLLAATGSEDFTYTNYFIGRSAATSNGEKPVKNAGFAAHQVMIRDGGLKLRLDQFDYIQGRTENWLAAVNINTTLPDMFPVKLPLKLFLDIGTYAEAWEKNAATTRFLYIGGIQLSVLQDIISVYAPLFYSKDFKTVLKSQPEQNSFLKRITFSINIQNITAARLLPKIPF